MLQNRVDPRGNIIKTAARGVWMGNRGQLHGTTQHILRPFKLKAWITCLLEFKGWYRKVMSPNLYTELFFLDEATAFAAGHRPCFECRKQSYNLFKFCWLKGNPDYGFTQKTSIKMIDEIMHAERIDSNGNKIIFNANLSNLPDGVFVLMDDQPYLIREKKLYLWTPFGYEKSQSFSFGSNVIVLTPKSVVNTFRAGYNPQIAEIK